MLTVLATSYSFNSETSRASWITFANSYAFSYAIAGWKDESSEEEAALYPIAVALRHFFNTSDHGQSISVLVRDPELAAKLNALDSAPRLGRNKELLGRIAECKKEFSITFVTGFDESGGGALQDLLKMCIPLGDPLAI
jgi:hypothetical protein